MSKYVNLLICTPRPPAALEQMNPVPIVGRTAQAYVTHMEGGRVVTQSVRNSGGRRLR